MNADEWRKLARVNPVQAAQCLTREITDTLEAEAHARAALAPPTSGNRWLDRKASLEAAERAEAEAKRAELEARTQAAIAKLSNEGTER